MASKVNVKFVVILSACLVLVGVGVGGAYYFVKMRSGGHYVALGDKAMSEGKFDVADRWYERAVGKEQFNAEWLTKWRAAREKKVPAANEYRDSYAMYQGILRNLAQAKRSDPAAHADYLECIYVECSFTGNRGAWDYLATQADEDLKFFEPEAPNQIRRYRGMALTELAIEDATMPKDKIEQARADLVAVLKANPKDGQAASELAVWYRTAAQRAKALGDETAAKLNADKSREVLVDLLKAEPDNPYGIVSLLGIDATDIEAKAAGSNASGLEAVKARATAMEAMVPRVAEAARILAALPRERQSWIMVNRFAAMAPRIDPKNGIATAMSLLDKLIEGDPENMDLLLSRAQIVSLENGFEELISAYQRVVDLKDKPVSFAGVRLLAVRNRARFAQANAALQLISTVPDAERAKAVERARTFRTQLARYLSETSPELQFIDGKSALLEGDIPRARRLLAEFLKKPGDVGEPIIVEGNLLMADVGLRSTPQEPGLAREHLRVVVRARPTSVEARIMLASVERLLQNYEGEEAIYKGILELEPQNATALQELKRIAAVRVGGTPLDDPVQQALAEAMRKSMGSQDKLGNDEEALQFLVQKMEELNYDPRLVLAVASARFSRNDREGAKQAVEAGLQKNPDEKKEGVATLRDFGERLKATDSLEGVLAFINKTQIPEIDKKMAAYRAYVEFKKPEEAARTLDEAEKLAPDDARVFENRFQQALSEKGPGGPDIASATRLADRATKLNLDQADGDTYKARIQIAQKNYRDAAATLARAVERGNSPASVYRLLGLVQAELGRTQDAMRSFRRAIELTPLDLTTIKLYLGVLVKANELTEALGVARKAEMVGRADPEFMNALLALEARGGRADYALKIRELIRKQRPKDTLNLLSLAELYLDQKAWDAARQLIDEIRKDSDSLQAVSLDARWHGDRGAPDKAMTVFRTYIGGLTEAPAKRDAYLAFGQFLQRLGRTKEAEASFRQAARDQDPATMSVDLMLGDLQLTSGNFEDAEKSYRKVLDAKVPDPDMRIRKRLIEALNQSQKFAAAEAECKALGAAGENDVEVQAQRAGAARGMGDAKAAKDILDRAIAKFPDEPMPYLRRARLLSQDPALVKDALADLATAIKLKPDFWQALRARAMIHLSNGRTEEGLRDLAEGVDRNPNIDDLRFELIDYLIRFGKESEAVDAADAALRSRPSDARLMSQFASSFVRAGRWSRAARYLKMMWEQMGDEQTALAYGNVLLNSTPPGLTELEAVLASQQLKIEKSPQLLVARAAMKRKQGKEPAAKADLLASFDLIGADPAKFMGWVRSIREVYPAPAERLKFLSDLQPPAQLQEWVVLSRAHIALENPKDLDDTIIGLRTLRDRAQDRNIRGPIQAALSEALLRQQKWEEALKEIQLGLEFNKDDALLNNNAASILTSELKDPRKALPYAERANQIVPNNWAYADTLADVYWALADKARAIAKLEEALRLTGSEVDKCKIAIKLATWKVQSGDRTGARLLLDRVNDMIADSPALGDSVKTELEKLKTLIESDTSK